MSEHAWILIDKVLVFKNNVCPKEWTDPGDGGGGGGEADSEKEKPLRPWKYLAPL